MWMHLGMADCRVLFWGQNDLDLVFRIIVSVAHLLYYLRKKSQIWLVDASWDDEVRVPFFGHCYLDLSPSF